MRRVGHDIRQLDARTTSARQVRFHISPVQASTKRNAGSGLSMTKYWNKRQMEPCGSFAMYCNLDHKTDGNDGRRDLRKELSHEIPRAAKVFITLATLVPLALDVAEHDTTLYFCGSTTTDISASVER